MNYVGKAANLYEDAGYKLKGSTYVVNKLLGTSWLWDRVRVSGGAYGGFRCLPLQHPPRPPDGAAACPPAACWMLAALPAPSVAIVLLVLHDVRQWLLRCAAASLLEAGMPPGNPQLLRRGSLSHPQPRSLLNHVQRRPTAC